jgi:lysyl oxidase
VRVFALLLCASCGDNELPPVPDAELLPDLTPVASIMNGSVLVENMNFDIDACELVEQCIGAAGSRRLLRFTTAFENIGSADLDLGPTPPPGVSAGIFVWSPCHMHHHVIGFASYELLDNSGVVATGHKMGFCIEDDEQIEPLERAHYTCTLQGISIGWADVYDRGLPCQWIDITDVASGTYTLSVTVDASGVVPDANPNNNTWSTTVSL